MKTTRQIRLLGALAALMLLLGCNNKTYIPWGDIENPKDTTAHKPNEPTDTIPKDTTDSIINQPDTIGILYYEGEIRPTQYIACYQGAYYRKAVSSKDYWVGLCGEIQLPSIEFDPTRTNPSKPGQYLDNPSVYMGGNCNGQETDIGLTWEVIRDEYGQVTPDRRAFRPFMRRTKYTPTGQTANYANAPAEAKYYWYPGETVTISLQIISAGIIQFTVQGAGKTFQTNYQCDGYTLGTKAEFKRVNAIDQVANEGKPVQPTKTKVIGAKWSYTSLYRWVNNKPETTAMHSGRFTDMRCPQTQYFIIYSNEKEAQIGAESITIDAGR